MLSRSRFGRCFGRWPYVTFLMLGVAACAGSEVGPPTTGSGGNQSGSAGTGGNTSGSGGTTGSGVAGTQGSGGSGVAGTQGTGGSSTGTGGSSTGSHSSTQRPGRGLVS